MIASEWLRMARALAADRGGRPAWVTRNRAVSTVYYALFHGLAELCARELVGARRPWPAFRHVYRSLEHAQARRVLDAVRREQSSSEALRSIGDLFADLQQKRHLADYDPEFRITTTDVQALLSSTEDALVRLRDLPSPERKFLAARLIGRPRN